MVNSLVREPANPLRPCTLHLDREILQYEVRELRLFIPAVGQRDILQSPYGIYLSENSVSTQSKE